ncbi:MAG: SsrA-binding protein SmpB [Gammaproteobacteria bacterium WSBS_2016_MAG_OTU1]
MKPSAAKKTRLAAQKRLCENRRATHDYEILESFVAGLVLQGWEVKSARGGRAQIVESYVVVTRGELFLLNSHFTPMISTSTHQPVEAARSRKLLMNAREIRRLIGRTREAGLTLIPLNMHLSRGKIKLSLGLARGKKQYDKRRDLQKRDWQRQQQRIVKGNFGGKAKV